MALPITDPGHAVEPGSSETSDARRRRVLVTLPDVAWPLDGGKRLRCAGVLRGLTEVADVDLVVLFSTSETAGAPFAAGTPVHRWLRLNLPPLPAAAAGVRLLADRVPWQIAAQRWAEVRTSLAAWTSPGQYDLAWFGAMDHALALGGGVRARHSLVDVDDIETDKWRAYLAQPAHGPVHRLERLQRRIELPLWSRVQDRVAAGHDGVVVCSEQDMARMESFGAAGVHVVPNSYPDPPHLVRTARSDVPLFLFVGNYAVAANVDAAEHLVVDVLPELRRVVPGAQVRLVGREAGRIAHLAGAPGLDLRGEVADVRPHLAEATAMIAPVRFGGGTRLKLVEAFAMGVPVISTWLGAMGLGATDDVELLLADGAPALAAAAARLFASPALGDRLARAARARYEEAFTPAAAAAAVRRAVEPLLAT